MAKTKYIKERVRILMLGKIFAFGFVLFRSVFAGQDMKKDNLYGYGYPFGASPVAAAMGNAAARNAAIAAATGL